MASDIVQRLRSTVPILFPLGVLCNEAATHIESQALRIAELEKALRDKFCPRPCNHRPDAFGVGDCVDAGECGCSAVHALIPEKKEG